MRYVGDLFVVVVLAFFLTGISACGSSKDGKPVGASQQNDGADLENKEAKAGAMPIGRRPAPARSEPASLVIDSPKNMETLVGDQLKPYWHVENSGDRRTVRTIVNLDDETIEDPRLNTEHELRRFQLKLREGGEHNMEVVVRLDNGETLKARTRFFNTILPSAVTNEMKTAAFEEINRQTVSEKEARENAPDGQTAPGIVEGHIVLQRGTVGEREARAIVEDQKRTAQNCYRQLASRFPDLEGAVDLSFDIDQQAGRIVACRGYIVTGNPQLLSCFPQCAADWKAGSPGLNVLEVALSVKPKPPPPNQGTIFDPFGNPIKR